MPYDEITPHAAQDLRVAGGVCLDVRAPWEFAQGHPTGAYNIPIMHVDPVTEEMAPNAEFERVVRATFSTDQVFAVVCRSGIRSAHACHVMGQYGFAHMHNVSGGFDGSETPDGTPVTGWRDAGLPVARTAEPGRDYASLLQGAQ